MKKIATSSKKIKVGFSGVSYDVDEKILSQEYAVRTYNFALRKGVLKSDLGIDPAQGYYKNNLQLRHTYPSFPSTVKIVNAFVYARRNAFGEFDDRIIAQTDENKLYYTKIFEVDTWHEISGATMSGNACAVNYNYNGDDVFLIVSETSDMLMINDTTATAIQSAPHFSSIAVHYERVYGTVNGNLNQVWFSDDMNPENWIVSGVGAGYITFADECGEVLSVVSFLGYLYVFREHGIFRLTAYGDQSEFSLKKVFIDTGMIYKHTISACGDKIIFLAEDGLFAFDGYDVTRLSMLPEIHTCDTAVGAYHNGRYYLACCLNLGDFYQEICVNNSVIEYDVKEKTVNILAPVDVLSLLSVNVHHATDVIVVLRDGTTDKLGMISPYGRIFGTKTDKIYSSPYNALGTDKIKIVKFVSLESKYALTLTVKIDGKDYSFDVSAKDGVQKIFVGKSGFDVSFSLSASGLNAYVSPLSVSIDVL